MEQLRRRIGLFNGRRVVAVATDAWCSPLTDVYRVLDGMNVEVVEFQNDPNLREVRTFEALYERVETLDPDHVTFWGHGKSVWQAWGAIPQWAEAMYETYLDYWPLVRRVLTQFPVAGSFKRHIAGWPPGNDPRYPQGSASQWHYSGSFLWFRNRDLFGKPDWRRIEPFYSGIEPWPSLHFRDEEAGVLFYEWAEHGLGPYLLEFWNGRVAPALEAWRQLHVTERAAAWQAAT